MKVSVLGCGRWGSFLAWYANEQGHDVVLWGEEQRRSFEELKQTRSNAFVTLNEKITLSSDLEFAVNRADIVIVSISAQGFRSLARRIACFDQTGKAFVLCMKGLEVGTGKRLSEIASEEGIDPQKTAVWVGPGHIQDFVKRIPNCMVIDSLNADLTLFVIDAFRSDLIRFYRGADLLGTEVGAAAKNVFGIAAGMLDGKGYITLKGPLMARGAREVARLIRAMGGNEISAYSLSHLGDYETTLFSPHSHNRRFGECFVQGKEFDRLAEGVPTVYAMLALSEKYGVELPITSAVRRILEREGDPIEILSELFSRQEKTEF